MKRIVIMSMATDRVGAQPRNLDYYLSRMSGYSKNTIRVQPQSKDRYNAGDTVIFRLPTNSILDLHTLTLRFAGQILNINAGTTEIRAAWPRYTQSLIRRMDVTMGGMQAGLGSLHDYGFLYQMLANHKTPMQRSDVDLAVTDGTRFVSTLATNAATGGTGDATASYESGTFSITSNATGTATSGWKPFSISNWLGIAGGAFMRFLVSSKQQTLL